jgi:hypothetical protein
MRVNTKTVKVSYGQLFETLNLSEYGIVDTDKGILGMGSIKVVTLEQGREILKKISVENIRFTELQARLFASGMAVFKIENQDYYVYSGFMDGFVVGTASFELNKNVEKITLQYENKETIHYEQLDVIITYKNGMKGVATFIASDK